MREQCHITLKSPDLKQSISLNEKFKLTNTRASAKTPQSTLNEHNKSKASIRSINSAVAVRSYQNQCNWWSQRSWKGFYDSLKTSLLRDEVFWSSHFRIVIRRFRHICSLWRRYFWVADEIRERKEQSTWTDGQKCRFDPHKFELSKNGSFGTKLHRIHFLKSLINSQVANWSQLPFCKNDQTNCKVFIDWTNWWNCW